ncbi:hypothetical protein CPB86DRAFT_790421 [Serendipita vermifera]|nr:hypothetical protein CPB86DRAFT_790421 [Serendipita vermifera]
MDATFIPSIKCVLIGDYDVGKTSLINAFATREPLNQYFPGLTGPIQIHIEHLYRLYLLHIHDTEGLHAPQSSLAPKAPPSASPQTEAAEIALSPRNRDPSDASSGDAFYGGDDDLSDDEDDDGRRRAGKKKWVARRIEYGLADVILICFSLANRASFEHVETVWLQEIQQLCPHVPFLVIGCKLDLRRPDPTTPPLLPTPRNLSSSLGSRRPKFTRSSTASTNTSSAGAPQSRSTSDFGQSISSSPQHPSIPDVKSSTPNKISSSAAKEGSSSKQPAPTGTKSAPTSDVEHTARKLKPRTSLTLTFSTPKAFKRKSSVDPPVSAGPKDNGKGKGKEIVHESGADGGNTGGLSSAQGPPPSAYTQPDSPVTAGLPSSVTLPRSPRHPNLPPFMRSLSHAAPVLRRVLSRSRAGTVNLDESPTQMTGTSLGVPKEQDGTPAPSAKAGATEPEDPTRGRPALPHRLTSGSADETSVVKLTTHVRTNSQPSPSKTSEEQGSPSPAERVPEGGVTRSGNLTTTTKQRAATSSTVATATTTSFSSKASPVKRVTRIEEPPPEARHHPYRNSTTSYQEARAVARRLGASGYMECSALTLVNVVKVFDEAVRIAVERRTASASSLHGYRKRGKRNEDCIIS